MSGGRSRRGSPKEIARRDLRVMSQRNRTLHRSRFAPPHCPHRECRDHVASSTWRFHRKGFRSVKRRSRPVELFLCLSCGRRFCCSAFTNDYWKKRPGLFAEVYHRVNEGQSLRGIARALGVSLCTVRLRVRWIARHARLESARLERELRGKLPGPFLLDGFRTFAGSQFEVVEINTCIEQSTRLLISIDPIRLRRPGKMTRKQRYERRRREKRLGRVAGNERELATRTSLLRAKSITSSPQVHLISDEEPAYARAVKSVPFSIRHRTTPASAEGKEASPLWWINHLHRMSRHFMKNVARETIAHSKSLAGLVDRFAAFQLWVNTTKGISERSKICSRVTPLMRAGLADRPWLGGRIFARRLFPGHFELSALERVLYDGRIQSTPLGSRRPYRYRIAA